MMQKRCKEFWQKYTLLMRYPAKFFKKVAKEKEWKIVAIFVAIFVFFGELIEGLVWLPVLASAPLTEIERGVALGGGIIGVIAAPLITILLTFLIAALLHLCVRIFKAKGKYFDTWKVVAYTIIIPIIYNIGVGIVHTVAELLNTNPTQSILAGEAFTWGPYSIAIQAMFVIVGLVATVHIVWAEMHGLSQYHKIKKKEALVAALLVVALGVVFAAGISGLVAMLS